MMVATSLLTAWLCAQTAPVPATTSPTLTLTPAHLPPLTAPSEPKSVPTAEESAARAADAAEKAAEAAQSAAQSAAKVADVAEKLAAQATAVAPAAPAVPAALKQAERGWTGTLDFGLIWLTGNTNSVVLNGAFGFSKTFHSGWILSFKGNGTYGEASPAVGQPEAVSALLASGQVRVDRVLSPLALAYLLGGADTDHIASIELRSYGEAGVSLRWLDRKEGDFQKVLLATDIGVRYADLRQFQYFPTEEELPELQELSPRISLAFRYALNKEVIFNEAAEVMPDVLSPNTVLFNNATSVTAHLVKALSLAVGFRVTYDSTPAPNKVSTDTALNVGFEIAL
jgi:putative salt-induced outer membrane protein YdiY